jgi:hypothetical protein
MFTPPAAAKDSAASVIPEIRPQMPWRVADVQALEGYRLHVRFVDGTEGEVNLSALVRSPEAGVFAPLADSALFSRAFVQYGAVTWPGGLDLAPDAMHRAIKEQKEWILR